MIPFVLFHRFIPPFVRNAITALCLLLGTSIGVCAETAPPATLLIPNDLHALAPSGPQVATHGRFEFVPVTGQPFAEALRAETVHRPAYPWDVQLDVRTISAVKKGDTLWLGLDARRTKTLQETGEALVEVIFEQAALPHQKLLERAISFGPQWSQARIPFTADRDAAAGELKVTLRLGYNPQTLELGALTLLNYGPSVTPSSLPRTDTAYEGSEPDHPWRAAAATRIEKVRKGDLAIQVNDSKGRPVEGAVVEVRMKRHAFAFGTAIQSARIAGEQADTPDNIRYRETIERNFNKVVIENDIKWPAWTNTPGGGHVPREVVLRALDWFREREIPVRGHVMVWPSWRYTPKFLRLLEKEPDTLRATVLGHIAEQTAILGTRLAEWDVINEAYAHHDLIDILGREAMADWFRAARAGAPKPVLFYNDYIMFSGEGPGSPSQHFYDTIRFLVDQGAPIGGIGEQGHFGGSPPPPMKVLATFDRFAAFGLPIQISEFDIDTSDEELQVAYTRDFLTAAFSHPSVTGVMSWGFWAGSHWKPRAAFWAKDWTLRPNGKVFLDLIQREWWTNANLKTDANGRAVVRGFCGEYEITVSSGDSQAARVRVNLPNAGTAIEVVAGKTK